jgi:hypothetical protein
MILFFYFVDSIIEKQRVEWYTPIWEYIFSKISFIILRIS